LTGFSLTMHTYQYVGIVLVVSRCAGAGANAVVAQLFPVRHGQVTGKLAGHEDSLVSVPLATTSIWSWVRKKSRDSTFPATSPCR
jgi:hypothetical protein